MDSIIAIVERIETLAGDNAGDMEAMRCTHAADDMKQIVDLCNMIKKEVAA